MEQPEINKAKQALLKMQEVIDLLESIKEIPVEIQEVADNIGYAYADLEHELNSL